MVVGFLGFVVLVFFLIIQLDLEPLIPGGGEF